VLNSLTNSIHYNWLLKYYCIIYTVCIVTNFLHILGLICFLLSQGLESLEGKTRDDFFSLLDREKQTMSQEQGEQLSTALEQQRQTLQSEHEQNFQQTSKIYRIQSLSAKSYVYII